MTMMNWVDYAIIAIIGFSIAISLVRGFVREALSLVTWAAAFWIAFTFSAALSTLLVNLIHTASLRTVTAFGVLFLITLLLGALINYLIGQLVDKTGLSGTDRLLGVIFGFARGVLLVTVLIMLVKLMLPQEPWWKDSQLVPQFLPIETWLHNLLPQSVGQHLILTN